jgi:hypothetical protein
MGDMPAQALAASAHANQQQPTALDRRTAVGMAVLRPENDPAHRRVSARRNLQVHGRVGGYSFFY